MIAPLNIDKLWKIFAGKSNPVNLIAQRFFQAFQEHGIDASKIPRLLPQIKLDDLKSSEALLTALTPDILDQTAKLFGIRTEWLEGLDDEIYEFHSCYKQPELFFELLATLRGRAKFDSFDFPLRIISSTNKLDCNDDREQLLVPILLERIEVPIDERIYRYHIYNDGFDWSHLPSRIQLKAIARLVATVLNTPIPIFKVSPIELNEILGRKLIPRNFIDGCQLTNPSLEDFIYTYEESVVAKEVDELPEVLKYIEQYKLEALISSEPPQPIPPGESAFEPESSPEPATPTTNKPKTGKRADNNLDLWEPVRAVASMLWMDNDSLPIADAIRHLKSVAHLKASKLSESAIRKRIADLAPPKVKGKPGRKPKQSS